MFNLTRKGFRGGAPGHSNEELLYRIIPRVLELEKVVPPKKISFLQSNNSTIYVNGDSFNGVYATNCCYGALMVLKLALIEYG